MMTQLTEARCVPCEGGLAPLTAIEIEPLQLAIPLWELSADLKQLQRRFAFKNFYKTMAFVNALAWIAHQENHHPDFQVGYNSCVVSYTTHAINGLSTNDFICAAKVDQLAATAI